MAGPTERAETAERVIFARDARITVQPDAPVYVDNGDGTRRQIGTVTNGTTAPDGLYIDMEIRKSFSFSVTLTRAQTRWWRKFLAPKRPWKRNKHRYGR